MASGCAGLGLARRIQNVRYRPDSGYEGEQRKLRRQVGKRRRCRGDGPDAASARHSSVHSAREQNWPSSLRRQDEKADTGSDARAAGNHSRTKPGIYPLQLLRAGGSAIVGQRGVIQGGDGLAR